MPKKLSKQFITQQKQKLEEEKEKSSNHILNLKQDDPFADPDHASDNAAVDTDVREQVGHETIEAEVKDLERRIVEISLALKKIEKGNYGVCEKCNSDIPIARLELVPEARFCIDCEKKLRK
jgi:DnaK suppressor protein